MKRARGQTEVGRGARAATGDSTPKELFSESQYVGLRDGMNSNKFKKDTYPEIAPMNLGGSSHMMPFGMMPGVQHQDFGMPAGMGMHLPVDELQNQLTLLTDSLDREMATNKLLEQKCEEYLSQLQRSADIIESSRDRHEADVEQWQERLEELENRLSDERNRRRDIEDEASRMRLDLEKVRVDHAVGESEAEKTREILYKRDTTVNELQGRIADLESEASNLKAELSVTRGEKARAEQDLSLLQRDLDNRDRDIRSKDQDLQRHDVKEEGIKYQLQQATDRVADLREETHVLKQDKEKLFSKVDQLMYENENLRNEIFMMKKIMLEVEKRDLHVSAYTAAHERDTRDHRREQRDNRISRDDPELEQMRNRPERPSRSPITQARENFGIRENAPRYGVAGDQPNRPQTSGGHNLGNATFGKPAAQAGGDKTAVKTSRMFNKGSQHSDILTWDNPYQSQGGRAAEQHNNRPIPSRGGPVEPPVARDRKMIEDQLTELDLQVEKTQID